MRSVLLAAAALTALIGCSSKPLVPYTTDAAPLVLLPAGQAGIRDGRGRFREISCAVLETHGRQLPNYRSCDDALVRVGEEPPGTGATVDLGASRYNLVAAFVPGIGWECFEGWLGYENEFREHLAGFGFRSEILEVDGLSGSETNARQVRDQVLAAAADGSIGPESVVLIGYSKGAPDVLTAIVEYPEIRPYVAAVVSVAGAVGGSPLANDASQGQLDLLRHIPESDCSSGDGKGVESLRPAVRQAWLQRNPLPPDIPFYSAVTYPLPDQVSSVLKTTQRKLATVDPRNDGQVIFYDQIIPGSTLIAYLNADHWAVSLPIAENHPFIGRHFADRNAYPRQALLEALMRYIEEGLDDAVATPADVR